MIATSLHLVKTQAQDDINAPVNQGTLAMENRVQVKPDLLFHLKKNCRWLSFKSFFVALAILHECKNASFNN